MAIDHLMNLIKTYEKKIIPLFGLHHENIKKELNTLNKFEQLISEQKESCFYRDCLPGHITGSAVLLDKKFEKIVLTHHKKLNKWLQLGGHSDGDWLTSRVAKREAFEESGIECLDLISPTDFTTTNAEAALPLDFDIHHIPARKDEPEHLHYDVRFIMIAHEERLQISDESNDLAWFKLDNVKTVTKEISTLRQIEKVSHLKSLFHS